MKNERERTQAAGVPIDPFSSSRSRRHLPLPAMIAGLVGALAAAAAVLLLVL
jgi:hypothetical protein